MALGVPLDDEVEGACVGGWEGGWMGLCHTNTLPTHPPHPSLCCSLLSLSCLPWLCGRGDGRVGACHRLFPFLFFRALDHDAGGDG